MQTPEELRDEVRELYSEAGYALYLAQCFENTINLILFLHGRCSKTTITLEQLESLEARRRKDTLGRLLAEMRKKIHFGGDIEAMFGSALDQRNNLAHHFFLDKVREFIRADGRKNMVEELRRMQNEFKEVNVFARSVAKAFRELLGMTDEEFDLLFREAIKGSDLDKADQ